MPFSFLHATISTLIIFVLAFPSHGGANPFNYDPNARGRDLIFTKDGEMQSPRLCNVEKEHIEVIKNYMSCSSELKFGACTGVAAGGALVGTMATAARRLQLTEVYKNRSRIVSQLAEEIHRQNMASRLPIERSAYIRLNEIELAQQRREISRANQALIAEMDDLRSLTRGGRLATLSFFPNFYTSQEAAEIRALTRTADQLEADYVREKAALAARQYNDFDEISDANTREAKFQKAMLDARARKSKEIQKINERALARFEQAKLDKILELEQKYDHQNKVLRSAQINPSPYMQQPDIVNVGGQPIDIANADFDDLPESVKKNYRSLAEEGFAALEKSLISGKPVSLDGREFPDSLLKQFGQLDAKGLQSLISRSAVKAISSTAAVAGRSATQRGSSRLLAGAAARATAAGAATGSAAMRGFLATLGLGSLAGGVVGYLAIGSSEAADGSFDSKQVTPEQLMAFLNAPPESQTVAEGVALCDLLKSLVSEITAPKAEFPSCLSANEAVIKVKVRGYSSPLEMKISKTSNPRERDLAKANSTHVSAQIDRSQFSDNSSGSLYLSQTFDGTGSLTSLPANTRKVGKEFEIANAFQVASALFSASALEYCRCKDSDARNCKTVESFFNSTPSAHPMAPRSPSGPAQL